MLETGRRYREWFLRRQEPSIIEAKSGYGLSLESECKILNVIFVKLGCEGAPPLRAPRSWVRMKFLMVTSQGRIDAYIDVVIQEMLPRIAVDHLAEYCDVFCEPNVFPVAKARMILGAAQGLGFGLRLHADQFSSDEGARLAAELGGVTADHLV